MTAQERIKINRFKEILRQQAESYDHEAQHKIVDVVLDLYDAYKTDDIDVSITTDKYGNVYLTKGKADIYPCVVAHLDQVHDVHKDFYEIHEDGDIIFAIGKNKKGDYQQVGTGSDDLAGVWLTLELLLTNQNLKVVYFLDEEVGCVGSLQCDVEFFKDCSFVLQGDRRSKTNDFIVYTNGVQVVSKKFKKAVRPILKNYNYDTAGGVSTDVGQLIMNGIGCCAANISCGYFNEHRDNEVSSINLSLNCLNLMQTIIDNLSYKRWDMSRQTPKPKEYKPLGFYPTYSTGLSKTDNIIVPTSHEEFDDMPLPNLKTLNNKHWDNFKMEWCSWADKYFPKKYGETRFHLGVPTPYVSKYEGASPMEFIYDVYEWGEKRHTKYEDFEDCPHCSMYQVDSIMVHLGDGHYRCNTCYSEIPMNNFKLDSFYF